MHGDEAIFTYHDSTVTVNDSVGPNKDARPQSDAPPKGVEQNSPAQHASRADGDFTFGTAPESSLCVNMRGDSTPLTQLCPLPAQT
jgi:hypothetical protein